MDKNKPFNLPLNLQTVKDKPVIAKFDGGQMSSDVGLLLLEMEQQIGLIDSFTDVISDSRDMLSIASKRC